MVGVTDAQPVEMARRPSTIRIRMFSTPAGIAYPDHQSFVDESKIREVHRRVAAPHSQLPLPASETCVPDPTVCRYSDTDSTVVAAPSTTCQPVPSKWRQDSRRKSAVCRVGASRRTIAAAHPATPGTRTGAHEDDDVNSQTRTAGPWLRTTPTAL